jgi:hypothetical protein
MKRAIPMGRVLVVAAVVFYFASVAGAGTPQAAAWAPPGPAPRLAHWAAVGVKDVVLDGVHVTHRILCRAAILYARLCIECTEIATDRALCRRA